MAPAIDPRRSSVGVCFRRRLTQNRTNQGNLRKVIRGQRNILRLAPVVPPPRNRVVAVGLTPKRSTAPVYDQSRLRWDQLLWSSPPQNQFVLRRKLHV